MFGGQSSSKSADRPGEGRKKNVEMPVMLFQGNAIFKEMKHII